MSSPLNIFTLPVGQMQANCYIVADTKTRKALIIDPGDDADYIAQYVHEKGLKPTVLLATHGHFDHIMGVTALQLIFKIPFFIHPKDAFLVERMQESAHHFLGINAGPSPIINGKLNTSQKIELGNSKFTVIETPGHTPGSVCFYSRKEKVIFVGDLFFAQGGVGRTDFSYSNPSKLSLSLAKIFKLPKDTVVYSGHGPITAIKEERRIIKS